MKPISKISVKQDYKRAEDGNQTKKVDLTQFGETPFTNDDLKREWTSFLDKLRNNGGGDSQIMVMKQPYDLDKQSITIHLSNAFQQDILMRFHQDLVTYLRKTLDNRHLEVKYEISEVERENKPYTNQDKFEYLAKINPALREMKNRLDLDADF